MSTSVAALPALAVTLHSRKRARDAPTPANIQKRRAVTEPATTIRRHPKARRRAVTKSPASAMRHRARPRIVSRTATPMPAASKRACRRHDATPARSVPNPALQRGSLRHPPSTCVPVIVYPAIYATYADARALTQARVTRRAHLRDSAEHQPRTCARRLPVHGNNDPALAALHDASAHDAVDVHGVLADAQGTDEGAGQAVHGDANGEVAVITDDPTIPTGLSSDPTEVQSDFPDADATLGEDDRGASSADQHESPSKLTAVSIGEADGGARPGVSSTVEGAAVGTAAGTGVQTDQAGCDDDQWRALLEFGWSDEELESVVGDDLDSVVNSDSDSETDVGDESDADDMVFGTVEEIDLVDSTGGVRMQGHTRGPDQHTADDPHVAAGTRVPEVHAVMLSDGSVALSVVYGEDACVDLVLALGLVPFW